MNYNFLQKQFLDYWKENGNNSLLGYTKSGQLFYELVSVLPLDGFTAEIGVFEGYTSKLIHTFAFKTIHFCYDTFCGINVSMEEKDDDFYCNLDIVKKNINMKNVIYKVGVFPETFDENYLLFKFVHSDTGTYIGTKTTIEKFKDIMVPGGKILFNDYNWKDCPGVTEALDEFRDLDKNFIHKPMPKINQYVIIKK